MPTYKRDANESVAEAMDTTGTKRFVSPGESIQTYDILGPGWTKTSDEPFYNPALAVHADIDGLSHTISLHGRTQSVEVWNNSPAICECYFNFLANTPGIRVEPYGIRVLPTRRRVSNLILEFSDAVVAGNVIVTERVE